MIVSSGFPSIKSKDKFGFWNFISTVYSFLKILDLIFLVLKEVLTSSSNEFNIFFEALPIVFPFDIDDDPIFINLNSSEFWTMILN